MAVYAAVVIGSRKSARLFPCWMSYGKNGRQLLLQHSRLHFEQDGGILVLELESIADEAYRQAFDRKTFIVADGNDWVVGVFW